MKRVDLHKDIDLCQYVWALLVEVFELLSQDGHERWGPHVRSRIGALRR